LRRSRRKRRRRRRRRSLCQMVVTNEVG